MNRIGLDSRLARLKGDAPSDPALAKSVLGAVVDVTMRDLLVEDKNLKNFAESMGIGVEEASAMTYGQVSVLIRDMWRDDARREGAVDALYLMTRPFMAEHKRRELRAKNKS